ncbi:MAG: MarR family transcriptional regulator [Mariprofundaceae bacterium]|nr:MarR family transcriptional regulator [Mariprofundaceae bacterium]
MRSRSRNLGLVVQGINTAQQNLSTLIGQILDPLGLNMSRLTVLARFSGRPSQGQTVSSIAATVHMNQPTVTKIVSYLIEKAWLTTEPDSTDARKKTLKITPAGLGVVIKAYGELSPAIDQAFHAFNDEQIAALRQGLSRLNED